MMLLVWSGNQEKKTSDELQVRLEGEKVALPDGAIIKDVQCGSGHTLLFLDGNRLFSWGSNSSGQLGLNSIQQYFSQPQEVKLPSAEDELIEGIACGGRHSFYWTVSGECFAFGNNFHSQLTYDYTYAKYKENQYYPFRIRSLDIFQAKVTMVACGARHSLFCLETGSVAAVGCNDKGQLGRGDHESISIVFKVRGLRSITHIACGNFHSLAIADNKQLYTWGYGKACGTNTDLLTPKECAISEEIVKACGGDSHSMALSRSGLVYSWGSNVHGQLGHGREITYSNFPTTIDTLQGYDRVVDISSQESLSAAATANGNIFCWGKKTAMINRDNGNRKHEAGLFVPTEISKPAGYFASLVKCSPSSVVCLVSDVNVNEQVEVAN